jgi:hypothetical protein
MKKVLFIAAVGVFAFSSCKKDYTCVCKDGSQTFATYTVHETKKKSKDACEAYNSTWASYSSSASCTIQ